MENSQHEGKKEVSLNSSIYFLSLHSGVKLKSLFNSGCICCFPVPKEGHFVPKSLSSISPSYTVGLIKIYIFPNKSFPLLSAMKGKEGKKCCS